METVRVGKNDQRHTTDQYGFRITTAKTGEHPPTKHIIMLGDSYTYGDVVNDEETAASQLQELLNRNGFSEYQVVNLGVSGFGPDQSYRQVIDKASALFPQSIILWSLSHNDIIDAAQRSQAVVLRGRLMSFPAAIHGMYWAAKLHVFSMHIFPDSRLFNVINTMLTNINPLSLLGAYERDLTERGHNVHVFQLPSQAYLESQVSSVPKVEYLVSAVQEGQELANILDHYHDAHHFFLDTEHKVRTVSEIDQLFLGEHEDTDMPKYARHLSRYGNQKYAEYLFTVLTEEQIISK
jgi:hypothetical protein